MQITKILLQTTTGPRQFAANARSPCSLSICIWFRYLKISLFNFRYGICIFMSLCWIIDCVTNFDSHLPFRFHKCKYGVVKFREEKKKKMNKKRNNNFASEQGGVKIKEYLSKIESIIICDFLKYFALTLTSEIEKHQWMFWSSWFLILALAFQQHN